MEILYLLIPMSVALVFFIAFLFWRSLKGGQFEDLEGPAYRILMDDDSPLVGIRGGQDVVGAKICDDTSVTRRKVDPNQ
jgi:cbb3-type cytochrome oxidase maturation protein